MYPMNISIELVVRRLLFAQTIEQFENGLVLKRNHKNQKIIGCLCRSFDLQNIIMLFFEEATIIHAESSF